MKYTKAEQALIWLCACTELDPRDRVRLLRAAGDPALLLDRPEKFAGMLEKPLPGAEERRESLSRLLDEAEEKDYFAVTAVSSDYPESLKVASPPLLLFGAGNRELLSKRRFCIVGSRITPPWAEKLGMDIAAKLSKRFAIVTGLAEGGDLSAVRGSLPSGNLICVLPCGLDECYPAAHTSFKEEIRRKGLLLSEYPFAEKARKYSFQARNKILAGLCEGVLVLSAGERSGALITANWALEYGRDVFVIPYNPVVAQGAGCNELLKKGAYVCTGFKDVFDCYGMVAAEEKKLALDPQEQLLYDILHEEGELHTAIIAERAHLPVYEAAALLSALELKGYVTKAGGNRYACVK